MPRIKRIKKPVIVEKEIYSKSIFASSTFFCSTLLLAMTVGPILYNCALVRKECNNSELGYITALLLPYIGTIQGRLKASNEPPVHTPSFLPGPNEEDYIPHIYNEYTEDSSYRPDK